MHSSIYITFWQLWGGYKRTILYQTGNSANHQKILKEKALPFNAAQSAQIGDCVGGSWNTYLQKYVLDQLSYKEINYILLWVFHF